MTAPYDWAMMVGGDLRVGEEVADGDEEHDHEADQGRDSGVERDRADDRPTPRVQQEAAQCLTLEQGGDLTGQLRVGGIGLGECADLRVGLAVGDRREVRVDELVGVRLRLRARVDLLTGVLLQTRELGGCQLVAALRREPDVLRVELAVDHVQAEVGAEQEQAAADPENDREDDLDDPAGADEAEQRTAPASCTSRIGSRIGSRRSGIRGRGRHDRLG